MKRGFVDVEKYGFKVTNKNRSNWAGFKKIFVRKSVAEALLRAKKLLPQGYNFRVTDGYRSVEDQRRIIQICERNFKRKYPKNWYNMLIRYTGGYKVLKEKPSSMSHMGGGAVDIALVKGNKNLELGGVTFDERDNLNYYEKKKRLTKKEKEIKENRRMLKKVMRKVGFRAYIPEWWHWGYMK